jgi:Fic family protein
LILHDLTQSEDHPLYQFLTVANGNRQYDFLRSIVTVSLESQRQFLSQTILKALNYHAIACLHTNAGDYRPCPVDVGDYRPPEHYRVSALMDDFVNLVNRNWETEDTVALSAYVLWRLNNIHPFINGNGRTARAACYFVLCVKAGGWLSGSTILPELLRMNRAEYVAALKQADATFVASGLPDLGLLHALISRLLDEQLKTTGEAESPSSSAE